MVAFLSLASAGEPWPHFAQNLLGSHSGVCLHVYLHVSIYAHICIHVCIYVCIPRDMCITISIFVLTSVFTCLQLKTKASSFWTLMPLRFFVGVGFGTGQPSAVAILMEISPVQSRALNQGLAQMSFALGELYCCFASWPG